MTEMSKQILIADSILRFWFNKIDQKYWFQKSDEFDTLVADKFQSHVDNALKGDYNDWSNDFSSRLALILLLDQFTRNIFRDDARAFSGDEQAISLTLNAVSEGQLENEGEVHRRRFLLMPLMHSEDIEIQNQSMDYFEKYTDSHTIAYAGSHRDIIDRFGRFPHRNIILGRESTTAEVEFLKGPNSSF